MCDLFGGRMNLSITYSIIILLISQNLMAAPTVQGTTATDLPVLDEKPFNPDSTTKFKLAKKLIEKSREDVIQFRPGRNTQEMIAVTELDISEKREAKIKSEYENQVRLSNARFDQLGRDVQKLISEIDSEIQHNNQLKALVIKNAQLHPSHPITAQKLAFEIVADRYQLSQKDRDYYLGKHLAKSELQRFTEIVKATKNPEERARLSLRFFNLKKLATLVKANPAKSAIGFAVGVEFVALGYQFVGQNKMQKPTTAKYHSVQLPKLQTGAK